MSSFPGIRRLSIAELDDEALKQLVRHGEDLLVERKRQLPAPPKFGAAVGSLANTLGGWLLLGVDDYGRVHGWDKPDRLDLQSHLAAVLRKELDPLPPFVAAMREVDGQPIAVVRVFESADAPHIVRGTGAVYVRSSKGKEPVDDHRTLIQLAGRGDEAAELARRRLAALPMIAAALNLPDAPPGGPFGDRSRSPAEYRVVVRAAPLTIYPALVDWPLTAAAVALCKPLIEGLVLFTGWPEAPEPTALEPFGRGFVLRTAQPTGPETFDRATIAADSGGVFAVELARGRRGSGGVLLSALLDDDILPALKAASAALTAAEAYGRSALDMWLQLPTDTHVQQAPRELRELHVAGELTVPADADEVLDLAKRWHRELQRTIGIPKFEPGPTDPQHAAEQAGAEHDEGVATVADDPVHGAD